MIIQQPYSKKQTATIHLRGNADEVFALMCPVKEYDWVPGWETDLIITKSGLVEKDCIFVTPNDGRPATWVTTAHDKKARALTMYKIVPNYALTKLEISVLGDSDGSRATISYEHVALNPDAKPLVDSHTGDNYETTMQGWEKHINQYLFKNAA